MAAEENWGGWWAHTVSEFNAGILVWSETKQQTFTAILDKSGDLDQWSREEEEDVVFNSVPSSFLVPGETSLSVLLSLSRLFSGSCILKLWAWSAEEGTGNEGETSPLLLHRKFLFQLNDLQFIRLADWKLLQIDGVHYTCWCGKVLERYWKVIRRVFLLLYSILVNITSLLPVEPVGNSKMLLFRDFYPGPRVSPNAPQ